MKNLFTFLFAVILINIQIILSQPWHYDFGTTTGNYTTTGPSLTFLPVPPTDTARVRIGAGGSFNLENQVIPFGMNTYLRGAASTSTSVNKFSVYNFTPGKGITIKFKLRLGASNGSSTGASSGTWQFFLGDGASYSDNNGFAGSQVFTGMQFIFGAGGTITTNIRSAGSWVTTGLPATPFTQGVTYDVEIYANNSTSIQSDTYGSLQTGAANTWDLWIDGVLAGNDLPKAQIANDVNMDSWMFTGISSSGNSANIFLDEFDYTNQISGSPLPVSLSSFIMTGESRNVNLSWSTLYEINNAGFELERRNENSFSPEWNNIAFIRGNGTTNSPQSYYYEDKSLLSGKYSYRLKQKDYNGNFEYFNPSNFSFIEILKPNDFTISQNYPNPSNPVTKIDYEVPFDSYVNITVFDITGRAVKELVNSFKPADFYSITFNGSELSSGIYFYRISATNENEAFTKTLKMLLVK